MTGKFQSFKTHDLQTLLKLSGVEDKIKFNYLSDWSIVISWNPELRYDPIGKVTAQRAKDMTDAVTSLLTALR